MATWDIFRTLTLTSVLITLLESGVSAKAKNGTIAFCQEQAAKLHFYRAVYPVKNLAGMGWDNLQNIQKRRVAAIKYFQCSASTDFRYFVPDGYSVSLVNDQVSASVLISDTLTKPISPHSNWINTHDEIVLNNVVASGGFSDGFLDLRKELIEKKAAVIQSQLYFRKFSSSLLPGATFSSEFSNQVTKIMNYIKDYNVDEARLEAENLVKEFGTHVVKSADAGAGLQEQLFVKYDRLKEVINSPMKEDEFKADIGSKLYELSSKGDWMGYISEVIHKKLGYANTLRTSAMRRTNDWGFFDRWILPNLTEWKKDAERRPYIVNREGEPLHSFIASRLPDEPGPVVDYLKRIVQNTIETYYRLNTHPGCTDVNSPNLDPIANIDDGSCDHKARVHIFGGVYKVCTKLGISTKQKQKYATACDGKEEFVPSMNTTGCPERYANIPLHTEVTTHSVTYNRATYTFYVHETYNWCTAKKSQNSGGIVFGGIYGWDLDNYITGEKKCPENFVGRSIIPGYTVCMSLNSSDARTVGPNFGGFFSCEVGNPLDSQSGQEVFNGKRALPGRKRKKHVQYGFYRYYKHPGDWGKRCPKGYTADTFAAIRGCYFVYCVKRKAKGTHAAMRKPPFSGTTLNPESSVGRFPGKERVDASVPYEGAAAALGMLGALAMISTIIGMMDASKQPDLDVESTKSDVSQDEYSESPPELREETGIISLSSESCDIKSQSVSECSVK